MQFLASRAYASLQARQAMNDLPTCFIDLSKAYDSVDRPLARELFSSLGFLQRCYSSSKTCMTTLCV